MAGKPVHAFSDDEIVAAVEQAGTIVGAADLLGISRPTLDSIIGRQKLRARCAEVRKLHAVGARTPAEPEELSSEASLDFIEIPVVHRDYRDRDRLYVYPLGDLHIGAPAHDSGKWEEWLSYLKGRKDVSVIGTGDFLNSAIKTSVSDVYEERSPVGEAKRILRKQLDPLKERVDILMPGNHEDRIWKAVGDCPIRDVADFLDIPYARDAVLLIYHVGQIDYHVYVRHGTGGGDVGARAGRLAKQARTCVADVYVSGHTHHRLAFPEEILAYCPKADRVLRKDRYFVSSGSFLRLESYAVKSGYAPTKLGAPRIFLSGEARDIHVSV